MAKIIKIGFAFKLHEKNYILTGFKDGSPLITCKETGQVQKIKDKILEGLLREEEQI